MEIGDLEYFCACLLKNNREHVVAADKKGNCVYCRYSALQRRVKESDLRCEDRYGEELDRVKREHLEILMKDRRHDEKVN